MLNIMRVGWGLGMVVLIGGHPCAARASAGAAGRSPPGMPEYPARGSGPDPGESGDESLDDLDLEKLLELEIGSGGLGSFGRRLESLNVEATLHGYVTFDAVLYDPFDFDFGDERPATFDIHYFNVFVGASMANRLYAEIQLEHEHGEEFAIRFAQLDFRFADFAILRAGLFLTPFGRYNETLYPEYITVLPRGPVVQTMRYIVPVVWGEVGLQLRGEIELAKLQLGYMLYVVNGLEQEDDASTPAIEDGGSVRGMRGNFRDMNDSDKAVGGRVYLRKPRWFEVGISGYTGAYTEDGEQRLTGVDVDLEFTWNDLLLRTEGAFFWQTSAAGTIQRWGTYSRLAYQLNPYLRPAAGFDIMRIDGGGLTPESRWQVVGGIDYRPWPESLATTIIRFAISRQYEDLNDDGSDDERNDIAVMQLTTGF